MTCVDVHLRVIAAPLGVSVRLPLLALMDGCLAVHLSRAQRSVVSEIPRKGLL